MKTKVLAFSFIFLLFMPLLYGQKEFGFTGEVQEFELKKLSISPERMAEIQANFPSPLPIEPLMIGYSTIGFTGSDFECFSFVDYYWDGSSYNPQVAFIVANYGNKLAGGTIITQEVKGPLNSKFQIKRSIPRMTVMLYTFNFNLANQVGMYELIGSITSPKIFSSSVKTRFYVEEIW